MKNVARVSPPPKSLQTFYCTNRNEHKQSQMTVCPATTRLAFQTLRYVRISALNMSNLCSTLFSHFLPGVVVSLERYSNLGRAVLWTFYIRNRREHCIVSLFTNKMRRRHQHQSCLYSSASPPQTVTHCRQMGTSFICN
jgi:hypothetical protein